MQDKESNIRLKLLFKFGLLIGFILGYYHWWRARNVGAHDAPWFGVEVVGSIA